MAINGFLIVNIVAVRGDCETDWVTIDLMVVYKSKASSLFKILQDSIKRCLTPRSRVLSELAQFPTANARFDLVVRNWSAVVGVSDSFSSTGVKTGLAFSIR